jgi:hypothetical protein
MALDGVGTDAGRLQANWAGENAFAAPEAERLETDSRGACDDRRGSMRARVKGDFPDSYNLRAALCCSVKELPCLWMLKNTRM